MYKQIASTFSDDEGVSPVIAVILMVAITVVLAATVYVWVSGFASEDTGPEQASATARGADLNDDGNVEWVRLSLTKGENSPYGFDHVSISATDPSGASQDTVCENATSSSCSSPHDWASGDQWEVGEALWIPCSNSPGNMLVTVSVRGSTILDSKVKCDADA